MTATLSRPLAASARPRWFRPGLVLAWLVLGLAVVAALWPALLDATPPDAVDPIEAFAPPSAAHPLGTDQLGRDVLSRVVHGARPSLLVGVGATLIATVVGIVFGMVAALGGRVLDEVVMRVTDVLLAFPGLLLSLLVVAIVGPGALNATLAIGAATAPGFVRLARGQLLAIREADYVRSAVLLGTRPLTVAVRHVLPNAVPPLLVLATVNVGSCIIAGSSLSFLGLGPPPPAPDWGSMLAESRDFLEIAWTGAVGPGVAVTATVLAVNVVGGRLRRRFEGRGADERR